MFIENVVDLTKGKLGKGQILVERVMSTSNSKMALPSGDGMDSTTIEKEVVILSNHEDFEVGDIIIDGRYGLGDRGVLKRGSRTFLLAAGHDIKYWVKPDNYKLN